ncbi:MAG: hypothetical protein ACRYGR_04560 [Janthinobacterium lividum]
MSLYSKLMSSLIVLSTFLKVGAFASENQHLDKADIRYIKKLGVSPEDYIESRLKVLKEQHLEDIYDIKPIDIAVKCLNITRSEYRVAAEKANLYNFTILDFIIANKIAQQKNIDIKLVPSDEIKADYLKLTLPEYYIAQKVAEKLGIDISEVTPRQIKEEDLLNITTKYQSLNDNEKKFLQGITKIDNFTYYQDLIDKKARLIMERLDDNNIERWKNFASDEVTYGSELKISSAEKQKVTFSGFANDGAGHFKRVIDLYPSINDGINNNQIWIAYITDNFDLTKQKLNYKEWEKSILYNMTVVTSPDALITSHMGISKTTHGVEKNFRGNSVGLHQFAAKIMLSLNSERRFMINAPAWVMESIIADALPEGLYAGTREMKASLEKTANVSFKEWLSSKKGQAEKSRLLKLAKYSDEENIRKPVYNEDNEAERQKLQDQLLKSFNSLQQYVDRKGNKKETLNNFLEQHPPIISLGHKGKNIGREMTIYESPASQNVFLKVSAENNSIYKWMFTEPFEAAGTTHYIAVDLHKLTQQ